MMKHYIPIIVDLTQFKENWSLQLGGTTIYHGKMVVGKKEIEVEGDNDRQYGWEERIGEEIQRQWKLKLTEEQQEEFNEEITSEMCDGMKFLCTWNGALNVEAVVKGETPEELRLRQALVSIRDFTKEEDVRDFITDVLAVKSEDLTVDHEEIWQKSRK